MKILITSNYAPPHGGVATTVYYLAKYVSRDKSEVTIVSFESGFNELKQCNVIRFTGFKLLNDFLFWPWELVQLFFLIRKQDIVFVHVPYFVITNVAAFFGRILGKKVVCMNHGPIFIPWRNKLHLPLINKLVDKWLFLNTENREFVEKYVHNIKPYKYVSNGIELDLYKSRKPVTLAQKFIFVGRLEKEKGMEELIKIAKEFPHFRFGCIGDGAYKHQLVQLTNVTCYGYLPHSEAIKIMSQYDCLLFPSHAESFGLVILEARALGLKIITTNCNSNTRELVNGSGIIVPIKNVNALVNAVKTIDSANATTSSSDLQNYDWKQVIKGYERELLSSW